MIEIDARGLSCPEPLMLVDKALKDHGNDTVKVYLTEVHSKMNVEKFAKNKGKKVTVRELNQEFELTIE